MHDEHVLWRLWLTFVSISLISVGGAPAVLPEMHRQVVNVMGWMDDATFANLFAVAQAAPGPNMLVSSLIGWQVKGLVGLLVATAGMIVPPAILAFVAGRILNRLSDLSWVSLAKEGLVPIAIGFFMAGGFVMARAADRNWLMGGITTASALIVFLTDVNPFWALFGGAAACVLRLWIGG